LDHDDRGNYSLIDATGVGMQQKLPLEKLKVVDNIVMLNDLKEIKLIIDDKTIDNKLEYCRMRHNRRQHFRLLSIFFLVYIMYIYISSCANSA
jgi:hypothetical protein